MPIDCITVIVDPPGPNWFGTTDEYRLFTEQLSVVAQCPVKYQEEAIKTLPDIGVVIVGRFNFYLQQEGVSEVDVLADGLRKKWGEAALRRTIGLGLERGDAIPLAARLGLAGAVMSPDFRWGLDPATAGRAGMVVQSTVADALGLTTDFTYPEESGYRKVQCTDKTLAGLVWRYCEAYWPFTTAM